MAWLPGWTYRKSITLSRASGAVTNYQMKLLLGESAGATGEGVDCGGLCLSTFNDIRFTTADGTTLLDYWIESLSGTTPNQLATIWIEFDSIGTGATTFYMYYGKAGASAVSNGDNTFLLFDHFDGDTLNETKWNHTDSGTGSRTITGSVLTQTVSSAGDGWKIAPVSATFGRVSIECLCRSNGARRSLEQLMLSKDANNKACGFYDNSKWISVALIGGSWQSETQLESGGSNVWRIFTQDNAGATSTTKVYDSSRALIGSKAWSVDLGTSVTMDQFGPRYVSATGTSDVDWIFVRQCLSTEPAWGTWGTSETANWLSNWPYRKKITLSRSSGAVINYQMKLLLGESAGATGEDVDCAGLCLSTFNDIRFTKADGVTLLDYWIENLSGTTPNQLAAIWIEFDAIGTSATTFYMYYGNASAPAVSNGPNTFIFFDDFSGDLSKWDDQSQTWAITGGKLRGTNAADTTGIILSNDAVLPSDNFAVDVLINAQYGLSANNYQQGIMLNTAKNANKYGGYWLDLTGYDKWIILDPDAAMDLSDASAIMDARTQYIYSLRKNGTAHSLYVGGTLKVSHTYTWATPPQYAGCLAAYQAQYAEYDDFRIRQYLATEPAWGTWEASETMNWLPGWSYRKKITLSRSSGAVTNYQMKLLLGESAGAIGEDVDCGSLCLSTFNDIRFTKADGTTLLDYWIESLSGTTPNQIATIWIEFDSIGTSATTFYVYYGKADASAVSNGANTFIFFDDFNRADSADVGNSWTEDVNIFSINTNRMKVLEGASDLAADCRHAHATFSGYMLVEAKCKLATVSATKNITLQVINSSANNRFAIQINDSIYYLHSSGPWTNLSMATVSDTYYILGIMIDSFVNKGSIFVDRVSKATDKSPYTTGSYSANQVMIESYYANTEGYVDWILTRQWNPDAEPAWGTWQAQENVPHFIKPIRSNISWFSRALVTRRQI